MGREPPDRGQLPLPDQVGLRRQPPTTTLPPSEFWASLPPLIGTWGSLSCSGCYERDPMGARPNIATSSNTEMAPCFSGWTPTPRTKLGGSRYTTPSPPGPVPGPTQLLKCPAQVPCPPGRSGPRGCPSPCLSCSPSPTAVTVSRQLLPCLLNGPELLIRQGLLRVPTPGGQAPAVPHHPPPSADRSPFT